MLDATKLIPEELVPIRPIGRLVLDRTVDNFFAETEQVAFCTQNVVPGIDFTNDPLLQGRNFSYLDTQLKRLGGPNFTQLPINAPKCPVAHFQQDGHMAMANPTGRVELRAELVDGDERALGRTPSVGFRTVARTEEWRARGGVRAESFADHYSQARQFYASQTTVEQGHIVDAFVFELSQGAARRTSAPGWSPTCATSTRRWRRPSPPASAPGSTWSTTQPAVAPIDLPSRRRR